MSSNYQTPIFRTPVFQIESNYKRLQERGFGWISVTTWTEGKLLMEQQENRTGFESVKTLKINKDYLHCHKFEALTKKNIAKRIRYMRRCTL